MWSGYIVCVDAEVVIAVGKRCNVLAMLCMLCFHFVPVMLDDAKSLAVTCSQRVSACVCRRRMSEGKNQRESGRRGSRQRLKGVRKGRSSGGKKKRQDSRCLMTMTGLTTGSR